MYKEPRARLITSERRENALYTVLQLSRKRFTGPLAPSSLISPIQPKITILILHAAIAKDRERVTFVTFDDGAQAAPAGSYFFRQWWRPLQLELARSNPDRWHFAEYAVAEAAPISRGWNHEHCQICYKRISIFEGEQHNGYFDGKEWLCASCFAEYIESGFGKRVGDFF